MTYEDVQKIQNEAAMTEIEQIQLEERLNKRFAKAEDAHAYVHEQKHADKLYVRREKDGTFNFLVAGIQNNKGKTYFAY